MLQLCQIGCPLIDGMHTAHQDIQYTHLIMDFYTPFQSELLHCVKIFVNLHPLMNETL